MAQGTDQITDKPRILVVEDEEIALKNLSHILKKEGYEVDEAGSGRIAIERLEENAYDLVLTDLKMEKIDGMAVLARTRELHPDTETIVITGYATVDSAVEALKNGAYHYIAKPYKIDEVRKIVREALYKRRLVLENRELKKTLGEPRKIPSIVGQSEPISRIIKLVRQVAPSDTNVLIYGESGTGKELVARAIHQLSPRAENPFIAFNCGSFTEELMSNELFGHEKGAFTGAVSEKKGLLEVADGGTVFLDEIGDMPFSMQVKLLRVIQEKCLFRVGGVKDIPVDVRFIAATHRDLKQDVENGEFRQDLYYRLNVINMTLPPLAERNGDIPLLAYHFLKEKAKGMDTPVQEIDPAVLTLLSGYDWPGNVRELENVIERALALENDSVIGADVLPDYIRNLSFETYRLSKSNELPTLEEQEKRYIEWVLSKCVWNKSHAAKVMGIDRVSLWRKIKRFGLEPGDGAPEN